MLEIKFVRQNLDLVKEATSQRGLTLDWDSFEVNDKLLKTFTYDLEVLRHERNAISNQIAVMKKNGDRANNVISKMRKLSIKIKELENELQKIENISREMMMSSPNLFDSSVPYGKDGNNNVLLREVGKCPDFCFSPLPHWIIGKNLGLFDLGRASKIAGARFPLLTGIGAAMERALINFMLDVHINKHKYCEILPPFIVNRRALIGTGQLPKFEQDLFKIESHDSFLVPTAEVPVTNMHQDEVLDESQLPISYVAYSPCFRAEAGSYGKDVKGLIRQHQFNKIELIKFSLPETSYNELEVIVCNAEYILKLLGLHYRVVNLCTGDLGFSASKTYDIEVWMPFQKKYIEISSCSNFQDFQARRANIRIKNKNKQGTRLLHTLNGSALAVGRTMAAIIENYQEPDGSVIIPGVLQSYMGNLKRIDASTV